MKNKISSSASEVVARFSIPKGKQSAKPEIVEVEEISYRPFMEEIVQEIQFTYIPVRERKTRKMIGETNTTGQ
jgi:hypothetical protein